MLIISNDRNPFDLRVFLCPLLQELTAVNVVPKGHVFVDAVRIAVAHGFQKSLSTVHKDPYRYRFKFYDLASS